MYDLALHSDLQQVDGLLSRREALSRGVVYAGEGLREIVAGRGS